MLTIPHHMGVSANNYGIANIRGENDEEKNVFTSTLFSDKPITYGGFLKWGIPKTRGFNTEMVYPLVN